MNGSSRYLAILLFISLHTRFISCDTITLSFSNGYKSHAEIANKLFNLKLNATFYLNSANIAFQYQYMNVFDIDKLFQQQFEIAGHTFNHIDLSIQNSPTIVDQICKDRATLIANGWRPTSFHYPQGKYNSLTETIIKECGYSNALISTTDTSIVYIQNPYKLPMYNVNNNISFDELVNQVNKSKGWTIFNFHDIPFNTNSALSNFLDWIKIKSDAGELLIKSVDTVVNGEWMGVPNEYINTPATYTPDRNAQLKIIIGIACMGMLVMLYIYVIITTQIKRRTKIKFIC